MVPSNSSDESEELTTYHVRQARQGNLESLEWLVEKFSPLLLANARYRLGKTLGALYDPEDIVNDVWLVTLPKLPELPSRDSRYTPVLLKFLSTTLLYRVNNLVEKHIRGKPQKEHAVQSETSVRDPVDEIESQQTAMIRKVMRGEIGDLLEEGLGRLDERDRELVILRGIEQQPYKEIATLLGRDRKILAVQYQRALDKLRGLLPGSIFEEFDED
jgi:RNA polymerase sigma factor (sigma-70 family)